MNCSKHTLINSHYELTMVPQAFGKEYFKGLWDQLSKVSQLAHGMLCWLVLWDPAVLAGLSLAAEGDGSAGWRLWHWGAFSLQLRQIMLSFNSWVRFQSGMEDSIRALAPNRTTTSNWNSTAAHGWFPAGVSLIYLKRILRMFYPQKAPIYAILKHFFIPEGKKNL